MTKVFVRRPVGPWVSPRGETPLYRSEINCAKHIRGRVRVAGRKGGNHLGFGWSIVNTRTGRVLVESDAFGLESAIETCSTAVQAVRIAEFFGLARGRVGARHGSL